MASYSNKRHGAHWSLFRQAQLRQPRHIVRDIGCKACELFLGQSSYLGNQDALNHIFLDLLPEHEHMVVENGKILQLVLS